MLDELFTKYHSDKGDKAPTGSPPGQFHCYGEAYEKYFLPLKDSELCLLEIGISINGHEVPSLCAWKDFFPNAKIVGMDIHDYRKLAIERVWITQGDQGDMEDLLNVSATHGPFDIIIDDGSHYPEHQLVSFGTLFNSLKSNGVYVVEDLHILGAMPWSIDQRESELFTNIIDYLADNNVITVEYFKDKWGCFRIAFIKKREDKPMNIDISISDAGEIVIKAKAIKETDDSGPYGYDGER